MKKAAIAMLVSMLTVSVLTTGCGGEKYADVKEVNEGFIALTDSYVADLEKAGNAKDAAAAINRFADGMEALWPKMEKLNEKYPELEKTDAPPPELVETQKKAEAAGQRMAGSMMKLMPYMQDAEVQKAQQRLTTLMSQ